MTMRRTRLTPRAPAFLGELGLNNEDPITLFEEVITMIFLGFVIGSMLWIPVSLFLFAIFVRSWQSWAVLIITWIVLTSHSVERIDDFVHSR